MTIVITDPPTTENKQAIALLKKSFDKPCATCETKDEDLIPLTSVLKTGFYNALTACFDGLPKEPKNILIIGGCRQWAMARRLGFLLPHSKIFVLDPNKTIVDHVEETIHCRFEFVHSPLTHFSFQNQPFKDQQFDLVMALNIAELYDSTMTSNPEQIKVLVSEIKRVTKHCFLTSYHLPSVMSVMNSLPFLKQPKQQLLKELGCLAPEKSVHTQLKHQVEQHFGPAKITTWPLPWKMIMY